ncbi:MAG: DmsE family decaheme c-type cytochrome [Terriglobales bacterium]
MHTYRTIQRYAILFAALALVTVFATAAWAGDQSKPAGAPASQYVGSDTCAGCHEDIAKGLAQTPHSRIKFQSTKNVEGGGCESCHGPGAAHVEGGGDKTKIISFSKLSTKEANARCLACHNYGNEHANFTRSVHATNDVGCTSCHDPHHSQDKKFLLAKEGPAICYSCHTEIKADFQKPFRHRVNQGLITCMDCHNEHGGNAAKQLRSTAAGNAVCFKCHTEKQGPFVYEHLVVKTDGCTACHTPHGSTNARLLKVSQVNVLCLQCHTATHNMSSSIAPIGPSKDNNARYQSCTLCHPYIHGSNSGNYLNKP